jgi:sensor domain CHASE-containing protein/HPt (histidine-containing phosphotransfer) domain-containing protein
MKLGLKTLLGVLATALACFTILWAVIDGIVVHGYARAEAEDARQKAERFDDVLASRASSFRNSSEDWAIWTELVEFARTHDSKFLEQNPMATSFASKGWTDVAIVTSPDLRRAYAGHLIDSDTIGKPTPGFEQLLDGGLVLPPDRERPIDGYAVIDGVLHIVTSQPIRSSDGKIGSVRGAFVTTRRIDDDWLGKTSALASVDLELRLLDELEPDGYTARDSLLAGERTHMVERSDAELVSTTLLRDFRGAPIALVEIVHPRPMLAAGRQMAKWLGLGMGAVAVILAALAFLFMKLVILRRVDALTNAIRGSGGGPAREQALGWRDELGELARGFDAMTRAVEGRDRDMRAANRVAERMRDHCGDGLILCDVDGSIEGTISAPVRAWFGTPEENIAAYLGASDRSARLSLEVGFEQIQDGFLPQEVLLEQLPSRVVHDGRTFQLSYRAIAVEEIIVSVLVIVNEVTDRLRLEARQAVALELQQVLSRALGDPKGLRAFLRDAAELVDLACRASDMSERKRALHTLKGNAAMFGFQSVASVVHGIEDALAVEPEWTTEHEQRLTTTWASAAERIRTEEVLAGVEEVEVSVQEQAALFDVVEAHRSLREVVASWRGTPAATYCGRLLRHARIVASRTGKSVDVGVACEPIRLDGDFVADFFTSLMCVVENAIEHGIEREEERLAQGKPAQGKVRIGCALYDGFVTFTVIDDGRGIAWDEVRGRSAGLSAVLDELTHLGGTIRVDGRPSEGTTFVFQFPVRTPSGRTIATTLPASSPARAA